MDVLKTFSAFYKKVGFEKPWIAYFGCDQDDTIVGGGAYKGNPKDGVVEISYGTFKKYEGQGIGSQICKLLVDLSLRTDPKAQITA